MTIVPAIHKKKMDFQNLFTRRKWIFGIYLLLFLKNSVLELSRVGESHDNPADKGTA